MERYLFDNTTLFFWKKKYINNNKRQELGRGNVQAPGKMALERAVVEQQLLHVAQEIENAVDDKLAEIDKLERDDDALEALREKRLNEMKRRAAKKQDLLSKGHGQYREIFGDKDFFTEAKCEVGRKVVNCVVIPVIICFF